MSAHKIYQIFLNIALIVFTLSFFSACNGGGGDGSSNATVALNVVLGPLIGADVSVYPLNNPSLEIARGITEDATDIEEAGWVHLEIAPEYQKIPLYLRIKGGIDIDANDDGIRDSETDGYDATYKFVLPPASDLKDIKVVANPLILLASRYFFDNLWVSSAIKSDYEPRSDPEAVRTIQRRIARAFLKEDVDGDGIIGWQDLNKFHPLLDQAKCNLPWDQVLIDVKRIKQQYFADVKVQYARWFVINPYNFDSIAINQAAPIEVPPINRFNHMLLTFITNKNGYKIKDIEWEWAIQRGCGIGTIHDLLQAGEVSLPGSISYTTQTPTNDSTICYQFSCMYSGIVDPPLTLKECSHKADSDVPINIAIGGKIYYPSKAEIGTYLINYKTTDGLTHQEEVYVYENNQEPPFKVTPVIKLDQENRIDQIDLHFEDDNGNQIEDPPILWGEWWLIISNTFRGEGYYQIADTYIPGYDYGVSSRKTINVLSPAGPFYPNSNGKKIFYEDALEMNFVFEGGDGTLRMFRFDLKDFSYYPDIRYSYDGEYVTFYPYHGNPPGEEVLSFKYQWGDANWDAMGDWIEVIGSRATVPAPEGANVVRYSAKGYAGFYYLGLSTQWRPLLL